MDNATQDQAEQQEAGEAQDKDYKALYEEAVKESRKWEKRSKDNLAQLNGLKESQGKPDPTIEERIAALEKENGDLKAASARAALVDSVAKATGLDRAIVATLSGADEDTLTEQAQASTTWCGSRRMGRRFRRVATSCSRTATCATSTLRTW